MSKDSLIKGTLILALAAFTARFLGVIQRIPLIHLLEDAGMATYGIAYNIYFALLIVATAGIPSALSKLISERIALGRYGEAQRIYRAAVWFAAAAGIVITALLYAVTPYYAVHIAKDPDAELAIQALAPALLLFPLIAIMRGYFQGRQMMIAGGLSQIVEQIVRVVTAIGLAYVLLLYGGHVWAVAGASFGGVMGGVGALAVMIYFWRRLNKEDERERSARSYAGRVPSAPDAAADEAGPPMTLKRIYTMIFKLSVPISLISLAVPIIYLIDSSTVIALLQDQEGYARAKDTLGYLTGRAQSLAGIPPILAIALSQSIVPIISSAYARRDMAEVNKQASLALRISVLSGLPVVIALAAAARPINGLLFADTEGTWIIAALTIGSIFQITMMTSGAILMGLGQTKAPMVHVFVGVILKLAGTYALAPWFGIYGIIAATGLCFIVVTQLNLRALRKTVDFRILGCRWPGFAAATIAASSAGVGLELWGYAQFWRFGGLFRYAAGSLLVCSAVLAVYALLLVATRVVTAEDIRGLPAPLQRRLGRVLKPAKAEQKDGRS